MKFRNLNFIFVCTMLIVLNACNKETSTPVSNENDMALEIKEYYPPEEVDVTEKVVGFLNHTKTFKPEASFKTEFKDMEVNEAMWTLEAASNYLVNENFKYESDIDGEVLNFELTFNVSTTEKKPIISGADLTEQFEQLFNDINFKVKEKNKLPKFVDFIFEKTEDLVAVFKVDVALVSTKPIVGLNRAPEPAGGWGQCNKMQDVFGSCLNPDQYNFGDFDQIGTVANLFKTQCADARMAAYWSSSYYAYNVGARSSNVICTLKPTDDTDFDADCASIIGGTACHSDSADDTFNKLYGSQADGSLNTLDVINNHLCNGNSRNKYLLDYEQSIDATFPKTNCFFSTQTKLVVHLVHAANRGLRITGGGGLGGGIGSFRNGGD